MASPLLFVWPDATLSLRSGKEQAVKLKYTWVWRAV